MPYKSVLRRIKPSKKEEKEMQIFTEKLVKNIRKMTNLVTPLICGSVAKDTWLSKKREIDLFLLFSPKFSKKELEKQGLEIGKKIVKKLGGSYELAFSEHPYLKTKIKGFEIDIVPCYSIQDPEKIKSSVDRTPFHVNYVQKNLKNPDDVRLLKQFCISNGCYGADAKRQAFSGYLCELLIIKYKTFDNCVREACNWRAGKVISFINLDKEKLAKKYKTPLIVIDPVDKNRNAGAAVSSESFYKFVKACKEFNKSKSNGMFFPKQIKPFNSKQLGEKLKKRGTSFCLIKFKKPKVLDDILYSQMRRGVKALTRILMENGFRVMRSGFFCNADCFMIYEMEIWDIPSVTKQIGPNVFSRHAENFLKHYNQNKTFIENDDWVVEINREFTNAFILLKKTIKKTNTELLKLGLPNKIVPELKRSKIFGDKDFFKGYTKSEKEFKAFFRAWFEEDLF